VVFSGLYGVSSSFSSQKIRIRHKITEENEHRDRPHWKAAREIVDAVGAGGMSGEETDGEGPAREKRLVRVPVQWIHSELTDLFHVIDTWRSAVNNEGMVNPHGNRPLTRLLKSKEPVLGAPTKGLPQNWYDETWFRGQSDPQKVLLNVGPSRPIPLLVSSIH
jgi:hypothetical protein